MHSPSTRVCAVLRTDLNNLAHEREFSASSLPVTRVSPTHWTPVNYSLRASVTRRDAMLGGYIDNSRELDHAVLETRKYLTRGL